MDKETIEYKNCIIWKSSGFKVNRTLTVSVETMNIDYDDGNISQPKYKYKEVIEFNKFNGKKEAICIGFNPALARKEIDTTNKRICQYLYDAGYKKYFLYNLYPEVTPHKDSINLEDPENIKSINCLKEEFEQFKEKNIEIIIFFGRSTFLNKEQAGLINDLAKIFKDKIYITTFNGEFIHPGSIGKFELKEFSEKFLRTEELNYIRVKDNL